MLLIVGGKSSRGEMQFVAVATSSQIYYLSSFSLSVVKYTTNSAASMDSFSLVAAFLCVYFRVNSVCRSTALVGAASLWACAVIAQCLVLASVKCKGTLVLVSTLVPVLV